MKVLVCDHIHEEGLKRLRSARLELFERYELPAKDLQKIVADYDVLVVRSRTKLTREIFESAPRLRAVARAGVGLDNIDMKSAERFGVKVISTPAAPTIGVAELTIGLILSILRRIPYADQSLRNGSWIKAELMGRELRSMYLGVIGAGGRIGLEVCRMASQGFGCSVQGFDIIDFRDKARAIGVKVANSLDELLRTSDIASIHVPYSPSTHHLIDSEKISLMKKGSVLINASRGDVIDGKAVLEAVRRGHLAGVGLDVYHNEPPVEPWEKELISFGNGVVVCTPHIGAQTEECQRLESLMVADEIISLARNLKA